MRQRDSLSMSSHHTPLCRGGEVRRLPVAKRLQTTARQELFRSDFPAQIDRFKFACAGDEEAREECCAQCPVPDATHAFRPVKRRSVRCVACLCAPVV